MVRQRAQRLAEQIKKEVSEIIQLELKDPGLVRMMSITSVEASRDLRHTKIFVSIYGSKEEQEKILKILEKASGFIRTEIGKRIRLRHVPEIEFRIDSSIEYGDHIERMLRDLDVKPGADNPR